jgi:hypothetical protein
MLSHHADAVAQILPEVVKPLDAAMVPAFLLEDGDVAERPQGVTAGFVERNAGGDRFIDEPIDVERKLLCHLRVDCVFA